MKEQTMNVSTQPNLRASLQHTGLRLPDVVGLAGALAGICGGLAMAIIGALLTHVLDQDIWLQLKVVGSLVLGAPVAAQSGFVASAVIAGLLIHLVIAALLGVLFEIGIHRLARLPSDLGVPETAGLAFGMLVWLAAYFVVLPLLAPALLGIYAPALIIQYLVYGAVTGLAYALLRPQPYASMG
jgi:hypothetical protein